MDDAVSGGPERREEIYLLPHLGRGGVVFTSRIDTVISALALRFGTGTRRRVTTSLKQEEELEEDEKQDGLDAVEHERTLREVRSDCWVVLTLDFCETKARFTGRFCVRTGL